MANATVEADLRLALPDATTTVRPPSRALTATVTAPAAGSVMCSVHRCDRDRRREPRRDSETRRNVARMVAEGLSVVIVVSCRVALTSPSPGVGRSPPCGVGSLVPAPDGVHPGGVPV